MSSAPRRSAAQPPGVWMLRTRPPASAACVSPKTSSAIAWLNAALPVGDTYDLVVCRSKRSASARRTATGTGVLPSSSRYTPTPKSTLRGSVSARNAAISPRMASSGKRSSLSNMAGLLRSGVAKLTRFDGFAEPIWQAPARRCPRSGALVLRGPDRVADGKLRLVFRSEGRLGKERGAACDLPRGVQPLEREAPVHALIERIRNRPGVAVLVAQIHGCFTVDAELIVARSERAAAPLLRNERELRIERP